MRHHRQQHHHKWLALAPCLLSIFCPGITRSRFECSLAWCYTHLSMIWGWPVQCIVQGLLIHTSHRLRYNICAKCNYVAQEFMILFYLLKIEQVLENFHWKVWNVFMNMVFYNEFIVVLLETMDFSYCALKIDATRHAKKHIFYWQQKQSNFGLLKFDYSKGREFLWNSFKVYIICEYYYRGYFCFTMPLTVWHTVKLPS